MRVVVGVLFVVAVLGGAGGAPVEPATRNLRANPLSALEGYDLMDLLGMQLDERFMLPKTLLNDLAPRQGSTKTSSNGHSIGNGNVKHQRQLQVPVAPPAVPTGAPTNFQGTTSNFFTSFSDSPSATPTASPTMASESPTAAPSAHMPHNDQLDLDDGNATRDADAAPKRGGGCGSTSVVVVAVMMAVMAAGILP